LADANIFQKSCGDQRGELWSPSGRLLATTHRTGYFKRDEARSAAVIPDAPYSERSKIWKLSDVKIRRLCPQVSIRRAGAEVDIDRDSIPSRR
jgi:hypothetical protein